MRTIAALLFTALLAAGCATQKINWQARVGNYTYDQAVTELGLPDKAAKLSDGSTVAEWLMQRGQTVVTPVPYPMAPPYYFGPGVPMYSATRLPARFLRLTFGPNNRLKAWKEFTR